MIDIYVTTGYDDKVVATISHTDIKDWLYNRQTLCKAMGYTTRLTDRMLHVVDDNKVHAVYFTRQNY